MNILMAGIFLFLMAFILHLLIWKFRIPDNPIKTIAILFTSNLLVGVFVLRYASLSISIVDSAALLNFSDCLHVALIYISFLATYYFVYGALVDESPSMITIMNLAKVGSKGLSETELNELITDDLFIKPRMDYLVNEKMVRFHDGKYKIDSKGRSFIHLINFFQNLMNLSVKTG
jgi:hypothetical protein